MVNYIYQGQTIMKWDTWKTLYIVIAIPLSLNIGIAINASQVYKQTPRYHRTPDCESEEIGIAPV